MKIKSYFFLIAVLLMVTSCATEEEINERLQKFSLALSTENVQLRGKLILFGEYKGDLSSLTYERYLSLLKDNEKESTQNVAKTVKRSKQHYFLAGKRTFSVVIYSRKLRAVVFDDANTFGCDSIKRIGKKEQVPDLTTFLRVK
ncbi:MAG: hypothetical protein NTU98_01140 [Bacteroidetes bacterium]|nr:hypothetical protein [Bacteroidota bacterium]